MFIDKVQTKVQAGNGGNGIVSFRHEIYVDRGGPDGGDGGDGGDVIMVASRNQNTLAKFRFQKTIKADDGKNGSGQRKHGKSGHDLRIQVPLGTIITDDHGGLLADLRDDGQEAVIAQGGKGGYGNAHFVSSVRQAPKVAERGEPGEAFMATLELKMIADVGLVGLPNAGKSTLLSIISNARPEIADYPFTTLTPNLGMVDIDETTTLLFADIPGLIEGASEGKGLGDDFLRHVERTKVLVHLIDMYNDSATDAYKTIQNELKNYKIDLTKRPQVIALTKIEGLDDDIVDDKVAELKKIVPKKSQIMVISAQSKQGIKDLLYEVKKQVEAVRKKDSQKKTNKAEIPVYKIDPNKQPWRIIDRNDGYKIRGQKIEKFGARTDFASEEGVRRLRDIMKKMGIMREIERRGIKLGDSIDIGSYGSFKY
jgi:GTP-binding protein